MISVTARCFSSSTRTSYVLRESCPDRVILSPPPREHVGKTQRQVPRTGEEKTKCLWREVAGPGSNRNVRVRKAGG